MAGLDAAAYGGAKDASTAWGAGTLTLNACPAAADDRPAGLAVPEDLQELWQERVAIIALDGGVPDAEAKRWAWASLPSGEESS